MPVPFPKLDENLALISLFLLCKEGRAPFRGPPVNYKAKGGRILQGPHRIWIPSLMATYFSKSERDG